GDTTKTAGRPCRVIETGSRCAVSSKRPKLFCASTEVIDFIARASKIAIIDIIAILTDLQPRRKLPGVRACPGREPQTAYRGHAAQNSESLISRRGFVFLKELLSLRARANR